MDDLAAQNHLVLDCNQLPFARAIRTCALAAGTRRGQRAVCLALPGTFTQSMINPQGELLAEKPPRQAGLL